MADRTLQELADDLKKGGQDMPRKLRRLLAAMALQGQRYAQSNYGVNGLGIITGNLKRSIFGRALTSGSTIGVMLGAGDRAQVKYAAIHEFGPHKRPYIKPAIDHLRREMPADLRKIFKGAVLGGAFK